MAAWASSGDSGISTKNFTGSAQFSRGASKLSRRDTGKRRLRMQGLPVATAGSTVIRSNRMEDVLSYHTNDVKG
jgi:hypothetical protein